MVIFMYGYGQPKKGQFKRPVYAGAVQVKDGIRFTYTAER